MRVIAVEVFVPRFIAVLGPQTIEVLEAFGEAALEYSFGRSRHFQRLCNLIPAVAWIDIAVAERDPNQRRARLVRFTIQIAAKNATAQGATNAMATPIMRKLHIIAAALCANVLRNVAKRPVSDETMFPWL